MSVLLLCCGLAALALPRLAVGRRGAPGRSFVRLTIASLMLGWALVAVGILLAAGVGAVHVASGTSLLAYDGHLAPGGIAASLLACLALALVVGRVAGLARRSMTGRRVARPDAWLGDRHCGVDHDVVVLPASRPFAYGVDGDRPQVVVSEGLLAHLDQEMARFVIDHERAHLRRGHGRALLLAAATDSVFGGLPIVRHNMAALRLAIECTADADAAGPSVPRRRDLAARLERLSVDLRSTWCATETLPIRARELLGPQTSPFSTAESWVAVGLAALVIAGAGLVGHAASDLPVLVASVSRG